MGRKRRNTAKTGDKALNKAKDRLEEEYNSRKDTTTTPEVDSDNDDMYGTVDRWHNKQNDDFIKLDGNASSEESEEEEEAVMDLGIDEEDSDEDDDQDSNDDNDSASDDYENEDAALLSASSDEEDDEKDAANDAINWGRRKASYYHGDTADLEIGQDKDEALEEEEAAKELQESRYQAMDEDDFVLSDDDQVVKDSDDDSDDDKPKPPRDLTKLSRREQQKIIDRQHSEMLPLMDYFGDVVKELVYKSDVAVNALFPDGATAVEDVGATELGQTYLLTKALLQSSAALNYVSYLLLKSEQAQQVGTDSSIIQSHPVLTQLQSINKNMQKIESGVEGKVKTLPVQLDNLVKAANLLENGGEDDSEQSEASEEEEGEESVAEEDEEVAVPMVDAISSSDSDQDDQEDEESDSEVEEKVQPTKYDSKLQHSVLNEARFGLRQQEVQQSKRKRRPAPTDFGDASTGADERAKKALSATLNTLEQKSKRNKRIVPMADKVDDIDEPENELKRGLEMMEAELGRLSSDEEGPMHNDFDDMDDIDGNDGDNDFYAKVKAKTRAKKEAKKALYTVPPKFPRGEAIVEGERAVSKAIMKNRGLVAHKPKINRNPRVKKREQYRKALIRRRGAVRDIRTNEGDSYGGEATGVKSNLSRSRKLAR